MKECTKCSITKPFAEFHKHKGRKDGHSDQCKECRKKSSRLRYTDPNLQKKTLESAKRYRENNKEKISEAKKKCVEKNPELYKESRARYYRDNKEKIREYNRNLYRSRKDSFLLNLKRWRIDNKGKVLSYGAKRRGAKIERTPKWLDKEDFEIMEWAYEWAKELEEKYKVKFHVDHIIPLRGKLVSGFHCPENLQVIPAYDNLVKSNKFEWCASLLFPKTDVSPGELYELVSKV